MPSTVAVSPWMTEHGTATSRLASASRRVSTRHHDVGDVALTGMGAGTVSRAFELTGAWELADAAGNRMVDPRPALRPVTPHGAADRWPGLDRVHGPRAAGASTARGLHDLGARGIVRTGRRRFTFENPDALDGQRGAASSRAADAAVLATHRHLRPA